MWCILRRFGSAGWEIVPDTKIYYQKADAMTYVKAAQVIFPGKGYSVGEISVLSTM